MKRRRWRLWLGAAVLILVAWMAGPWSYWWIRGLVYGVTLTHPADDPPFNHPLIRVEKDTRPSVQIDPKKPCRIEFGRGSGWHGLDTITISEDGTVVLHVQRATWYKATMQLTGESLAKVWQAVEDNHLLKLHKAYHGDVADGTQWVLWIKQGQEEKATYFNNHFPKEVVNFASSLDAILAEGGAENLNWGPTGSRDHEKELWDSIKR